jgi:hypothetical protein
VLAWGSEHGPRSDPNHFAVAPSSSGHWIGPAVRRFERGECLTIYRRAVAQTMRRYKLL